MFSPQSFSIIQFKSKVPQLLGDAPPVLSRLAKVIPLGALLANVLKHARRERPSGVSFLIRVLLREHVHEPNLLHLVPFDQLLCFVVRIHQAL